MMAASCYAALPGWRRPYGAVDRPELTRARERHSLADAICDLLPLAHEDVAAAVREEWSPDATDAEVRRALRELEQDGAIRWYSGEWVRRG